ncbi:hypothetical protein KL86CLO1_12579 [uncultured Eubacteriales bacterium]|uniref:Uncharacterized protein n=1 Tax=uncultured Eubacteriales bacterium TaxID=172733 RepID=A0A212KBM6_9FIRM|nr:hypothetical protein KL86CLO1_12579 [uncultured Eubacteriales bacterium]
MLLYKGEKRALVTGMGSALRDTVPCGIRVNGLRFYESKTLFIPTHTNPTFGYCFGSSSSIVQSCAPDFFHLHFAQESKPGILIGCTI